MAQLAFVQAIAAGATFDPLTQWQYRYAPRAGQFSLMIQQADLSPILTQPELRATITSGSDTLMEESPLQKTDVNAYGSYMPTPERVVPVVDAVDAGDLLKVLIRNVGVAAVTVAGIVEFN